MQFVQQGKMKALAVAAKKRIPQMPDVPTSAEAGFPGFELEAWIGILAPAGTPPAIVATLNDAARTTLNNPQVKAALEKSGVELRYMNPTQFDATIRKDIQYWSKVIKTANITVD
jgi:tripartite-type tricarboxylate transporter receptor subunit TctC